jgi:hypothetical protein
MKSDIREWDLAVLGKHADNRVQDNSGLCQVRGGTLNENILGR